MAEIQSANGVVLGEQVEEPFDDSEHCDHHQHDDRCGGWYEDCDDDADDYCVHCDCCCTCLGCEYGPRDGMLTYPDGPPPEAGDG